MADKNDLASKLYKQRQAINEGSAKAARCFIGFDGFTDEIIHPVQKRSSPSSYTRFEQIADFGKYIVDAAGKSCNIELVVQRKKLGGNAPIMTRALVGCGHAITFAGAIGTEEAIEPIFQEMAEGCERLIPLGPSAHSDAIEFEDGKVILGKLDALSNVNFEKLTSLIDKTELTRLLDQTDLFVCANWTMLPSMNDIWRRILNEIVPEFKEKKKRDLFIDLADPGKRTDEDLREAMQLLAELNKTFNIVMGLNQAEATRILDVLTDSKGSGKDKEGRDLAKAIREKSKLHTIVVHGTRFAMAATEEGLYTEDGPYCPKPKITTGAGDNFNAGFCTALLYGLKPDECLLTGVATSGYYVRNGNSPTIEELSEFLKKWSEVDDPALIE